MPVINFLKTSILSISIPSPVCYKYIFQDNPSKTKGEEKRITDTIEVKSTVQGSTGGKGMKYHEGGPRSGHAKQDFGRESMG